MRFLFVVGIFSAAMGASQTQASDFFPAKRSTDQWTQNHAGTQDGIAIDNYDISGLQSVMSREHFNSLNSVSLQGEIITVDTHNSRVCQRVREMLAAHADISENSLKNLCTKTQDRYVSIVRLSQRNFEFHRAPTIGDQIEKFNLLGVGMMGVIASLPAEVTNWEEDVFENALDKWKTNVSNPPVVDKDDWMINYIGHPVSGAAYYIMARQTGLGAAGSFGFSVMMSTFFWEYGLEALAEKPSIQDLILTPTLGALLGEQMFRANERIKANDNQIMGSKGLGKVGLVITDPVGALIKGLTKLGNNRYLYDGRITWTSIDSEGPGNKIYSAPGVRLHIKFGHK